MPHLIDLIARQAPPGAPPGARPGGLPGITGPPPGFKGSGGVPSKLQVFMPMLMGTWIDSILMGVIIVMAGVWWYTTRPIEKRVFRYLVYWLVFASFLGQGAFVAQMFRVFVIGFGVASHDSLKQYVRWYGLIAISSRLPAMAFVLHRAYLLLERKKWILVLVTPMLLAITVLPLTTAILVRSVSDAIWGRRFLAAQAVIEVCIDFILATVIGLRLRRLKTGFSGTDRLISKMLRTLAETQLPQAAAALVFVIITAILPPSPTIFIVLPYPKVQPILILISLMDRKSLEIQSKQGAFANTTTVHDTALTHGHGERELEKGGITTSTSMPTGKGKTGLSWKGSRNQGENASSEAGSFVAGNLKALGQHGQASSMEKMHGRLTASSALSHGASAGFQAGSAAQNDLVPLSKGYIHVPELGSQVRLLSVQR